LTPEADLDNPAMSKSLKNVNFDILVQSTGLNESVAVPGQTINIIEKNKIDWNDLFIRADFHCIKPALSNLLNKIPGSIVPNEILQQLKEATIDNARCQMLNLAEFFEIKKLLDEAGIVAVPFKGFWLAHNFYGNLADRESVDVDLLIDIKDLEKIKTMMATRGYTPEEAVSKLTADYIVSELCEYNFDKYEDGNRVSHFEFHWRISMSAYQMNIKLNDLKSQIIPGAIQNKELSVFTPSANFLLAVMHHGGKDQFAQLKQVLDIAYIINRQHQMDWAWIIQEAKRFHVEHLVYIAIRLAALITGLAIPGIIKDEVNQPFIQKLANDRIDMMATPIEKMYSWQNNFRDWNFQVRSRSSNKLKLRLITHKIRREILPALVPKKLHYLFLNKKIRTGQRVKI
jgi:hypothetical protein